MLAKIKKQPVPGKPSEAPESPANPTPKTKAKAGSRGNSESGKGRGKGRRELKPVSDMTATETSLSLRFTQLVPLLRC